MSAPAAGRMHRLAQAFRARLRSEVPAAGDVSILAIGVPGFGLAVRVEAMAPWRYSDAALGEAALGPGATLLSPAGEKLWADLNRLGLAIAGPAHSFALLHEPDALIRARVKARTAA